MFHVFCTITKINFNSITMVPLESGCQRVFFCFVLMVVKNKDSLKSCRLGSEFYYCLFIYLFMLGMHQLCLKNQVFLFVSESRPIPTPLSSCQLDMVKVYPRILSHIFESTLHKVLAMDSDDKSILQQLEVWLVACCASLF